MLYANLADDRLSWTLGAAGRWVRAEPRDPDHPFNAQVHLAEKSQKRARRGREEVATVNPLLAPG